MSELKVTNIKRTLQSETVKKADNNKKTTTVPVGQPNGAKPQTGLIIPSFSDSIQSSIVDITNTLGLKPYNLSLTKDSNSMLRKSQTNLIDLIKYYEGDADYYYEGYTAVYSDNFGKKTTGFGHYFPKKTIKSQEDAYSTLANDLREADKNLKNKIGKETFNSLPLSIKEALIDLAFNKGANKLNEKPELMKAIKNKDYSKIVANLYYLTSGSNDANKNKEEAGLYRRSLSRAILAARDLSGKELEEAKKEIDAFYNKAKNFYINNKKQSLLPDLENIYKCFKKEPISTPTKYADNFKIVIKKGGTLYSTANEAYNALNDTSVSMKDYRKVFYKLNKIDEQNPPQIKAGEELLAPSINNVKLILGQTEIAETPKTTSIVKNDTSTAVIKSKIEGKTDTLKTTNIEEPSETEEESSSDSWWKPVLSGIIGGGIFLAASRFFRPRNPVMAGITIGGTVLGVGAYKLIKHFKNKKEQFNPSSPNTTPFQRLIHDTDVKITEINRHEITLPDGKKDEIAVQIAEKKYTVKPYSAENQETIWKIAKTYGMSRRELGEYNDLKLSIKNQVEDYHEINAGQVLTIKRVGYKVEKGDKLESIAEKFGITKDALVDANNIYEEDEYSELNVGTILELPALVYKIKKGDNLSTIAQKYGTTIDNLKRINNLNTNTLSIGQELIVTYTKDPDQKTISTKTENGNKIEIVKVDVTPDLKNRPELQKKTIVDGKVVATRAVFEDKTITKGPLSGKTIILDAGHGYNRSGGTDCGATASGIEHEWLLNYDNVMKLKNKLVKQGAKVIYLQGQRGLIEDAVKEAQNKANLFISIHANTANKPKDRTQIYYRDLGVSGEAKENSIKFAKMVAKNFNAKYKDNEFEINGKSIYAEALVGQDGEYNGKPLKEARTGMLKAVINSTKMPSVIWEVGFMDSPTGKNRLNNPTLMNEYADVVCKSIIEYFNK